MIMSIVVPQNTTASKKEVRTQFKEKRSSAKEAFTRITEKPFLTSKITIWKTATAKKANRSTDKKDLKKIFFALRSIRENIIPKRKQVKKTKSLTFCKKSTTLLSIPHVNENSKAEEEKQLTRTKGM